MMDRVKSSMHHPLEAFGWLIVEGECQGWEIEKVNFAIGKTKKK